MQLFAGPGCVAVGNYLTPTVTDNCPGATVLCAPPSGSNFPAGVTTVTCRATDVAGNKDSCSFAVTVNPSADLSIIKTDHVTTLIAGDLQPAIYTITVQNNGPCTATNVVVTDILPPGLTFFSCSSSGGGVCVGSGNNRIVTFASVAVGPPEIITDRKSVV